jgi:alpha-amylase
VGNFEHVFIDSYERCYLPFLETLLKHEGIKVSLHYTGSLLEWIERRHPEFFVHLKLLVSRKQIELIGGGFYEPVAQILPEGDFSGQIEMMKKYLAEYFDTDARGVWLAERVWDMELPGILSGRDVKYTFMDDYSFIRAGLNFHPFLNFFTAEKSGCIVSVFPLDTRLKNMIPFADPAAIIDYLRGIHENTADSAAICFGDDGEKFGLRISTKDWFWEGKWLDRFFSAVEQNKDWLQTSVPGEIHTVMKSSGKIYFPPVSYPEMMEWAESTDRGKEYRTFLKNLENAGLKEQAEPFIHGSIFLNFLNKYREADLLHKKMLHVSNRLLKQQNLESADADIKNLLTQAQKYLYKGQGNSPFWHGLFGGIYLNNLRHAAYENLISAECILDAVDGKNICAVEKTDYDLDGEDEIILRNREISFVCKPSEGGNLLSLDYKTKKFNLLNVMTRRKELYHEKQNGSESHSEPADETVKDSDLIYDRHFRASAVTHFFNDNTLPEDVYASSYLEEGDFIEGKFQIEEIKKEKDFSLLRLLRNGLIKKDGEIYPLEVIKEFRLDNTKPELEITHIIHNTGDSAFSVSFGIEMNLTLLAGSDKNRLYKVEGIKVDNPLMNSRGEVNNTDNIILVDFWKMFKMKLKWNRPVTIWRYPVETISQSEDRLVKNYQGSCLIGISRLSIYGGGIEEIKLVVTFEDFSGD